MPFNDMKSLLICAMASMYISVSLFHLWMFFGCSSQVEHQEFEFYVSQVTKLFICFSNEISDVLDETGCLCFSFNMLYCLCRPHSFLLSVKIIFGWKPFTKVTELMITQCYVGKEYLHNVFIATNWKTNQGMHSFIIIVTSKWGPV